MFIMCHQIRGYSLGPLKKQLLKVKVTCMSFVGDLEHLPIVDLIQLLHSTKKSGTLALKSRRGESQLVFSDGYIVSANHYNNSIRVGQVLVDIGAITAEQLELALQGQKDAGNSRVPLIAMLIETGVINKDVAYKGLEMLIEMTIVDILTWTSGTFELEMDKLNVSDEYRYFPDTLKQTLNMNTQSILMDALRIYDEKMRDGTLSEATFGGDSGETIYIDDSASMISAMDLGLDDLDNLEKKIPEVFTGVKFFDPAEALRKKIKEDLSELPAEKQEKIIAYLLTLTEGQADQEQNEPSDYPITVIVFSSDNLITNCLLAACKNAGIAVFTTDEEDDLDPTIEQSLSQNLVPVVVLDSSASDGFGFSKKVSAKKWADHKELSIIQLVGSGDQETALDALRYGVRTIFPRPDKTTSLENFVEDIIKFTESFRAYLTKSSFKKPDEALDAFVRCTAELGTAQEIPDLSFALLRYTAEIFERSITFIVGSGELIAERAIGIKADKESGATPPLRFKIPIAQSSTFEEVINNATIHYGLGSGASLKVLYDEIGSPIDVNILLLPIVSFGRVIALTYADFGRKTAAPVPVDVMACLSKHASLIFDNILMRKKLEKQSQ